MSDSHDRDLGNPGTLHHRVPSIRTEFDFFNNFDLTQGATRLKMNLTAPPSAPNFN